MPRRDRRSKRSARLALTARTALALTIGPVPIRDDDLSEELLAKVWREHRGWLLATAPPGSPPWGWWRFEGPPSHRARRPALVLAMAGDRHCDRPLERGQT